MAFTVGLPRGMRIYDFEAYVRMLERDGIDLASTPRVRDPWTGDRWLRAWGNREDAEHFAARLRKDTRKPAWQVYEFTGVEPAPGPLGPLEVLVTRQSEGYAYGLSPVTEKLISRRFPDARQVAYQLFVSTDTTGEFEDSQGAILDHVAFILTGLDENRIKELGGYRVCETATQRILRETPVLTHSRPRATPEAATA